MAYPTKAFAGQGTLLQLGDGESPEQFDTIGEIRTITRSGSKADTDEVTNMDSEGAYREHIATLLDAGEVNFTANYIPSDAGQLALAVAFEARTRANWKIVLATSSIQNPGNTTPGYWAFTGFVTVPADIDFTFDKGAVFSGKIKITGPAVYTDEAA